MKVVVISQRVDQLPDRNETRDALDQSLAAFVAICGHVPVPVPNALGGAIRNWLTVVHPAAVVLSGGNDIGEFGSRTVDDSNLCAASAAGKKCYRR